MIATTNGLSATSLQGSLKAGSVRAADGDYKAPGAGHMIKDSDGDYKPTLKVSAGAAAATASGSLAAVTMLSKGG